MARPGRSGGTRSVTCVTGRGRPRSGRCLAPCARRPAGCAASSSSRPPNSVSRPGTRPAAGWQVATATPARTSCSPTPPRLGSSSTRWPAGRARGRKARYSSPTRVRPCTPRRSGSSTCAPRTTAPAPCSGMPTTCWRLSRGHLGYWRRPRRRPRPARRPHPAPPASPGPAGVARAVRLTRRHER